MLFNLPFPRIRYDFGMAKYILLSALSVSTLMALSCSRSTDWREQWGRELTRGVALIASRVANASSDGDLSGEARSFYVTPTGNGHGFQLFDTAANRLIGFLDHPYKYLRARDDVRENGVERRNLVEELGLGLNENGQATWFDNWTPGATEYLHDTNIIRNRVEAGREKVERLFFAPFGLEKNASIAMFRLASSSSGPKPFGLAHLRFHLGANPVSPNFWESTLAIVKIPGEKIERLSYLKRPAWVETGHGLGAMIYIPLQTGTRAYCQMSSDGHSEAGDEHGDTRCEADDLGLMMTSPLDTDNWFGVLVAYVEDVSHIPQEAAELEAWLDGRLGSAIVSDTLSEFKAWRKHPRVSFHGSDEKKLWRQSETILRMAQIREPNRHAPDQLRTNDGMILASLAPGGWSTGWVRDGTYSTVALARSGHFPEAKKSLNFFLNSEPVGVFKDYVGGYDYRISLTRYYGDGREECDYSNQPSPNIETDGWGLFLWAARQYVESSGDLNWLNEPTRDGSVYEAMKKGVAEAIESQLEPAPNRIMKPDSSIWEVHQHNARHFAYTTLTAARGLCDFAAVAKKSNHPEDHAKFAALAEEVRRSFLKSFATPEGHLVAALERSPETDLDGAVTEAFGFDLFYDLRSPLALKTLAHLEKLKLPTGGFKRIGDSIAPYEINEWAFIDYRMAGAYFRMGKRAQAQELIDRTVKRASLNFYLFPEMYNAIPKDAPIGYYLGSNPMVGYGPGVYFLSLLEREGLFEPRACE